MKKLALALAGSAAFAIAAPASAATIVLNDDGSDTLTGEFTGNITAAGPFTREYTFVLPTDGVTAASLTTIAVSLAGNIDFTSVTLNGQAFSLSPNVDFGAEFASITLDTTAGLQTLIVNGIAGQGPRGNTSAGFGGVVTFTPDMAGAIPEPGMWALMILGFGFIGGALRSRRNRSVKTSFDFA